MQLASGEGNRGIFSVPMGRCEVEGRPGNEDSDELRIRFAKDAGAAALAHTGGVQRRMWVPVLPGEGRASGRHWARR